MESRTWSQRASLALDGLAAVALAYVAWQLGADHARWVALDAAPTLDEDSMYHVDRILGEWRAFLADPGWATLYPVGNYPPLLSWLVWAEWARGGVSGEAMRSCQVVLTPVQVVGAGVLAWRAWGRAAAPAAAALAVTVPLLWLERSNVMLALAVTALVTLTYATVPLDFRRLRPGPTALAGVAAGLALLAHLSAVYFVVATGVGAVVEAAIAVRKERALWRVALGRLTLWTASALAVCVLYYARSLPIILHVLEEHDRKYVAGASLGLWARLPSLARIKHAFFLDWYQTGAMVGLGLAILCAPWRPMVRCVLIAVVGGYFGIVSFPQAHDRYLLPLVPLFGVLALAPLGLLAWPGRWRLGREVLALGAGLYLARWGLDFSAAAFGPRPAPATLRDAEGPKAIEPRSSPEVVLAALLDGPAWRQWAAPGPHRGPGCAAELAQEIAASEAGAPASPQRARLLVTAGVVSGTSVDVELRLRGTSVEHIDRPVLTCMAPRCYVVTDRSGTFDDRLVAAGYTAGPDLGGCVLWTAVPGAAPGATP